MITFRHTIQTGAGLKIEFSARPSAEILAIVKAAGLRWQSNGAGGGYWWRRRIDGAADFLLALQAKLDRAQGVKHYHKCWKCGSAQGELRPQACYSPVYCDRCHAWDQNERAARHAISLNWRQFARDARSQADGIRHAMEGRQLWPDERARLESAIARADALALPIDWPDTAGESPEPSIEADEAGLLF